MSGRTLYTHAEVGQSLGAWRGAPLRGSVRAMLKPEKTSRKARKKTPGKTAAALTHLDARGRAKMVDVGAKDVTLREAVAEAIVTMEPATFAALRDGKLPKGDVPAIVRIAGIQAAKRTPELIPLCHAVALSSVSVDLELDEARHEARIVARARAADRTGVEMEALTAASVAALTLYDMCKAIDRGMTIARVRLLEKRGGKSGDYKVS